MGRKFLVLMLVGLAVVATAAAETAPPKSKKSHKKKAAVVQPAPEPDPTPAPPPPPLTPEQGPSYPPEVTFQAGQLTIVARNSTMADVLTAVRQKTGAAVDMPAASGERVVGRFGPGSPRDVMAQLLNGSHYDYVLMGSPADPGALKKVVLMARTNGPAIAPAAPVGFAPRGNQNLQAVPDIVTDDQSDNAEMPEAPEQQEEPQPEAPQPDANGSAVKTPEQLLRELQQQQQQPQPQPPQQDPPQ
jgi:serine/threonine-protein kinase